MLGVGRELLLSLKIVSPKSRPWCFFAGAHIVLPHWYTHFTPFGLLLPETSDGRVLFLLPWEGQTIAGTTDAPAMGSHDPRAKAEDVDFLVHELASYLGVDPMQMKSVRGRGGLLLCVFVCPLTSLINRR